MRFEAALLSLTSNGQVRLTKSQRSLIGVRRRSGNQRGYGLWMSRLLVCGLGKTSLHLWQIEEIIVLASHDIGKPGQVCDDGTVAILTIQSHRSPTQGN
uniref:Uncharacterized protein n=1 Tax=Thermosporothrix sp. COM3 TaxID=2490863 RepID=A0A455SJT6_9CHLR|nr:hypothetical protein KTC_11560 [Thermosporothrix sp. COM3]